MQTVVPILTVERVLGQNDIISTSCRPFCPFWLWNGFWVKTTSYRNHADRSAHSGYKMGSGSKRHHIDIMQTVLPILAVEWVLSQNDIILTSYRHHTDRFAHSDQRMGSGSKRHHIDIMQPLVPILAVEWVLGQNDIISTSCRPLSRLLYPFLL